MSDTGYAYFCETCGVAVPHGVSHFCAVGVLIGPLRKETPVVTTWQVPVPDPTNERNKELEGKLAEAQADADRLAEALEKILAHSNLPAELREKGIISDETNPGGLMYALNGCREVAAEALASRPEAAKGARRGSEGIAGPRGAGGKGAGPAVFV